MPVYTVHSHDSYPGAELLSPARLCDVDVKCRDVKIALLFEPWIIPCGYEWLYDHQANGHVTPPQADAAQLWCVSCALYGAASHVCMNREAATEDMPCSAKHAGMHGNNQDLVQHVSAQDMYSQSSNQGIHQPLLQGRADYVCVMSTCPDRVQMKDHGLCIVEQQVILVLVIHVLVVRSFYLGLL